MGLQSHYDKKGMPRASADVGLMFVAYNIRRIMNILGKNEMIKYLKQLAFSFSWKELKMWLKLSIYNPEYFLWKMV